MKKSDIIPDGSWVKVVHPPKTEPSYTGEVLSYRSNAETTGYPVYLIQPDRAVWGKRTKPMYSPAEFVHPCEKPAE